MKKRRELDALVSGKQSSNGGVRLTTKNGKHELLRNDSESSDVEEFSLPDENAARKRGRSMVCTSCVTVLWVFLLVSCVVAVSGLFFLHFKLKSEVDQLRHEFNGDRIQQLTEKIGELRTNQQQLSKTVEELSKGERGVERILINVSMLMQQVSSLNSTTRTLSEGIASSSQFLSLPQQFSDLSKNIASIGSNVETMQGDIKDLVQTKSSVEQKVKDLDAKILTIQLETVSKISSTPGTKPDSGTVDSDQLKNLTSSLARVNHTLELYISETRGRATELDSVVADLRNYTSLINTRLTFLELKSSEVSTTGQSGNLTELISSTLQEQMERIHNATNQDQLISLRNQLSSLQAQCGNDSAHIVELMNEVSNVARITGRLIKSADSRFQSVNSSIERLWSVIGKKNVEQDNRAGHADSSDDSSLSARLVSELEVTRGQAEGSTGQQALSTSTTVQPQTSVPASRAVTTVSRGSGESSKKEDEKSRLKRLLDPR